MSQKNLMPIREFSRLTGIRSENLRFYDQIGLLSPEIRGENSYRYYSRRQLSNAYLISSLRGLSVGLEEIRHYSLERSPEKMLDFFARQEERIKDEIARLTSMHEIMQMYTEMAREAMRYKEDSFLLEQKKKEPLFLCPVLAPDTDDDDGGILSYDYAERNGINAGSPMGIILKREHFEAGQSSPILRYFFRTGKRANGWKPAGLYAVAYGHGDLDHIDIHRKLLAFIRAGGLRICSDVYGEVLLDEMAVQSPEEYEVRIDVRVEKV